MVYRWVRRCFVVLHRRPGIFADARHVQNSNPSWAKKQNDLAGPPGLSCLSGEVLPRPQQPCCHARTGVCCASRLSCSRRPFCADERVDMAHHFTATLRHFLFHLTPYITCAPHLRRSTGHAVAGETITINGKEVLGAQQLVRPFETRTESRAVSPSPGTYY